MSLNQQRALERTSGLTLRFALAGACPVPAVRGQEMRHHGCSSARCQSSPAPSCTGCGRGLACLSGLFLHGFCFSGGKKKPKRTGSSLTALRPSGCKCPQKLTGGLCVPKQRHPALSPAMPSAAPSPLPWGAAGCSPHGELAVFFLEKEKLPAGLPRQQRPSGDHN